MRVKTLVERTAWEFVLGFMASLPLTYSLTKSDLAAYLWSALSGGVAALGTFLKTAVFKPDTNLVWLNIAERGAWAFVLGAAATIPEIVHFNSVQGLKGLGWAALTGGINGFMSFAKNTTAAAGVGTPAVVLNTELGPIRPKL